MHQFIVDGIRKLNQNWFFKFISSIRLAVPLMLALIISVAAGTIFESLYNSEYAKLVVYNQSWFYFLLALLWLNVFVSMMSRYPWRKNHVGFVLTHIGILVLLIGSFITGFWGIDGSLQITQGQSNSSLQLPRLMIGYQFEGATSLSSVVFEKSLFAKSGTDLSFINNKIGHVISVEKFVPFANLETSYQSNNDPNGPVSLGFGLKSQFFDVKEWLHSSEKPTMSMGPATLKLTLTDLPLDDFEKSLARVKKSKTGDASKKAIRLQAGQGKLKIYDLKTKTLLKDFTISEGQKGNWKLGDTEVILKNYYRRAIVANNKLAQANDLNVPVNPALELEIANGGKKVREVLYAKYPGFTLNKDGVFGLQFELISEGNESADMAEAQGPKNLPAGHPNVAAAQMNDMGSGAMGGAGNIIEFVVSRNEKEKALLVLKKGNQLVATKKMSEGDNHQTPWMGIQVYLGTVNLGSISFSEVKEVKPEAGRPLPHSAVFVRPSGFQEGFWLSQGEDKEIMIGDKRISVFFGNEIFELPFSVSLDKFSKKDYPGTETPYSFESLVRLNDSSETHLISMNEPLKSEGFTMYQASFIMNPGQAPVSVLSTNQDPGRSIKYLGSLILSLGIVIFTLMKSRVAQVDNTKK